MPKFKVLKGVAHNIGDSFTILMNYSADDYSLGHTCGSPVRLGSTL